jgi:hypothetical protein
MIKPKEPRKPFDKGIHHWIELYLQAKINGDNAKMKMYGAILLKLGEKIPK